MAVIDGTDNSETLDGTPDADIINGLGGNDILNGRASADILDGGIGNDAMYGGGGWDIYYVDSTGDAVNERLREGRDEVRTALSSYTLTPNVENLTYIATADFAGTGNSQDNEIRGGVANDILEGASGNDRLYGSDGNDVLNGGFNNDVMVGGRGNDVYYVDNVADRSFELGRSGTDEIRTTLTNYTLGGNIENLTYIGGQQFIGTGSVLRNVIQGGGLDDILTGAGGNDRLIGGGGNDTAVFSGNRADYTITTIGVVTTVIDNNAVLNGNDGVDTLTTIEQLQFADETVFIGDPAVRNVANLDGGNGFRLDGENAADVSGGTFASAGDVNNDGFDDILIGARGFDPNGIDAAGASYVVFGKADGWNASQSLSTLDGKNGFRLVGFQVDQASGQVVASAGDVNGDGFDDVIVGAPSTDADGVNYSGASYVIFGQGSGWDASIDLSTLDGNTGFRLDGQNEYDLAGSAISSAGDVNGDGFDDLMVRSAAGAYVIFGKSSGWTAAVDLSSVDGNIGFHLIGGEFPPTAVSSAGDVNGDGFDDIAVSHPYADPDGVSNAGASYIVFGKASGWTTDVDVSALSGSDGFRLDGGFVNDGAGWDISSAGDVNGDGFDDLLIGEAMSPYYAPYTGGVSYVVFGKASGWDATTDLSTLDGTDGFQVVPGVNEDSIWSVASAGDINGDGFDDIIVGGPFVSYDVLNTGSCYVIYGKASGWDPTFEFSSVDANNGFRIEGQEGDQIGRTVSSAGDVNGDGFDDLMVGSEDADPNGLDAAGSTFIIFGGNFTGSVTHLGTDGDDTLTGTAAAETFVGGLGNDILNSGGGADAFQGGAGDDTIRIGDTAFFNIDGGHGTDTITLNGAGLTFDLTSILPARIDGIEQIDVGGTGNNELLLSISDVLDLSDDSNTLLVAGNAGDTVIRGAGWTNSTTGGTNGDGTSTIDGQVYQHYTAGQAQLLVDTDITSLVS